MLLTFINTACMITRSCYYHLLSTIVAGAPGHIINIYYYTVAESPGHVIQNDLHDQLGTDRFPAYPDVWITDFGTDARTQVEDHHKD